MSIVDIPIKQLQPHPANSNVMAGSLLDNLIEHIKRHDRYPPIIVRELAGSQDYQIIDGHHRVRAVEKLGCAKARCVVWQADDALRVLKNKGRSQEDRRIALIDLIRLWARIEQAYEPRLAELYREIRSTIVRIV